jgi:hypothetical protein
LYQFDSSIGFHNKNTADLRAHQKTQLVQL